MHAWGALKPADIVSAARALRDMVSGERRDDDAVQDADLADAPPPQVTSTRGSAPAE